MSTGTNSTTLEQHLAGALSDLLAADDLTAHLGDNLAWDVGLQLLAARAAIQKATDLLNALPAFSRHDAEPRTA